MKKLCRFPFLLLSIFVMSCADEGGDGEKNNGGTAVTAAPALSYNITKTLPHDTSYFIEGLEFYNGYLIESTGNYGRSRLVKSKFPSGEKVLDIALGTNVFGEGVTVFRDTVYQLTYKEQKVLMYDVKTFKLIGERQIQGEGWGLTNDSTSLIATKGNDNNLYFYQPGTFKLLKVQGVTENGVPVIDLNELEYVNGFIYANQWRYNYIYKIDPKTGAVVGKMDLTPIADDISRRNGKADVLNGIAYNKENGKFYVTGKYWQNMYEIDIAGVR